MPTPSGKPQVGDMIVDRNGIPLFQVLERLGGLSMYSVRVKRLTEPNAPAQLITEFDWWLQHRKWRVVAPGQTPEMLQVRRDDLTLLFEAAKHAHYDIPASPNQISAISAMRSRLGL